MKTVRPRQVLRISLATTILVGLGSACAQVAGIEDRNFDGADIDAASPECIEYCDLVEGAANDGVCPNNYTTMDTCLGVCAKLPPGDPNEPAENTVACRLNAAKAAKENDAERPSNCQAAGPGGNGACGTNCESYCMLVERDDVCGDILAQVSECEDKCLAFGDSKRFHVGTPTEQFDHSGDTVQCRLVHVSSAAARGADDAFRQMHCGHADFHSTLWCFDDPPTCSRYCDVQEVACQGEYSLYENRDQCEAACAELELGPYDDDAGDTVACRTYHAVSSLSDPVTHCAHAGPTGDGHCGHDVEADEDAGTKAEFAACRPYCLLIEAACPTEFNSTFDSGEDCVEQCDASDASFGAAADQDYSVDKAKAGGDNLICRTYHAVKALADVPNAADFCPSAFGASPCN